MQAGVTCDHLPLNHTSIEKIISDDIGILKKRKSLYTPFHMASFHQITKLITEKYHTVNFPCPQSCIILLGILE
jgi:hypothetical protein